MRYSSDPASYGITTPGTTVGQGQVQAVPSPGQLASQELTLNTEQGEVESVTQMELALEQPTADIKMYLKSFRNYEFVNRKLSWRDTRETSTPIVWHQIDWIKSYHFFASISCNGYGTLKKADIYVLGTDRMFKVINDLQDRHVMTNTDYEYSYNLSSSPENMLLTAGEFETQYCPVGQDTGFTAKRIKLKAVLEYTCEKSNGLIVSGSAERSTEIFLEKCNNNY